MKLLNPQKYSHNLMHKKLKMCICFVNLHLKPSHSEKSVRSELKKTSVNKCVSQLLVIYGIQTPFGLVFTCLGLLQVFIENTNTE